MQAGRGRNRSTVVGKAGVSVTYEEFMTLATKLAEGDSEIEWRNAAARAYYAAYHRAHMAVDLCPENGHFSMGSHERLAERFQAHGSNGAKSIAYILAAMKKIRVSADYEIFDPFESTAAINQISQVKVFAEKIQSFENTYREKTA